MAYEINSVDYLSTTNKETVSFAKDEQMVILESPDERSFVLDMKVCEPDLAKIKAAGWNLFTVTNCISRVAELANPRFEVEDEDGNTYTELGGKEVIEQA